MRPSPAQTVGPRRTDDVTHRAQGAQQRRPPLRRRALGHAAVQCSSECDARLPARWARPSAFGAPRMPCRGPLGARHAPPAESRASAVAAIDAATPLSSMVFAKFRTSACGAVSLSGGLATLLVSLCAKPRDAMRARCDSHATLSAWPVADRMARRVAGRAVDVGACGRWSTSWRTCTSRWSCASRCSGWMRASRGRWPSGGCRRTRWHRTRSLRRPAARFSPSPARCGVRS